MNSFYTVAKRNERPSTQLGYSNSKMKPAGSLASYTHLFACGIDRSEKRRPDTLGVGIISVRIQTNCVGRIFI